MDKAYMLYNILQDGTFDKPSTLTQISAYHQAFKKINVSNLTPGKVSWKGRPVLYQLTQNLLVTLSP